MFQSLIAIYRRDEDLVVPKEFMSFMTRLLRDGDERIRMPIQSTLGSGKDWLPVTVNHPGMRNKRCTYPFIVRSSLSKPMKDDILELVGLILERLAWRVTQVTYALKKGGMIYFYYGSLAILLWRCGFVSSHETDYKDPEPDEFSIREQKELKQRRKYNRGGD